jgi:hypothetical protein
MRWNQTRSWLLIGAFLSGGLVGCENPTPPGRIDSYSTVKEEGHASGANVPSMLEFSDQVSQKLMQDVSSTPEFRDSPTQLVISLGDINNKTNTPTTDFELIQTRIRSQLLGSRTFRNQFIVIADRERIQRQMDQRTGDPGQSVQRYDPAITYLLLGDFLEANREGRSQYLFSFSLTNLKSGVIVFEKSYDLGQMH